MAHAAAAISLDSFRRRGRTAAAHAPALAPEAAHPLVGAALGVAERRYGLMTSRELVSVADVVGTSGDLAVSDRLAFLEASRRGGPVVVIELDGWYVACVPTHVLESADYAALQPAASEHPGAIDARVMSIATPRGIAPVLGPLAAV